MDGCGRITFDHGNVIDTFVRTWHDNHHKAAMRHRGIRRRRPHRSGAFGDPSVAFAEPGWGAFDNWVRNGLAAGLRSGPVAYEWCNKSGLDWLDWLDCRNHIATGGGF